MTDHDNTPIQTKMAMALGAEKSGVAVDWKATAHTLTAMGDASHRNCTMRIGQVDEMTTRLAAIINELPARSKVGNRLAILLDDVLGEAGREVALGTPRQGS